MSRTPFDAFSKALFEELLTPFGTVQIQKEVLGESQFIDLYFVPTDPSTPFPEFLGILSQMGATSCLIEPFSSQLSEDDICDCEAKILALRSTTLRDAKRENLPRSLVQLPRMWILAPTVSVEVLASFEAKPQAGDLPGVYHLPVGQLTTIVVIHQLPVTLETLWLRLLGRGRVLQQAVTEVLALHEGDSQRAAALQLLVSWKISIEVINAVEEQEVVMALSQAYLEWELKTKQEGRQEGRQEGLEEGLQHERSLVLRQLDRKLGSLPAIIRSTITNLSLTQLEALGEALLDFESINDLQAWLEGL
jgi:transcription termination factor NusB